MAPTDASPPKRGGASDTKYDIDNVVPVLLAALGNPAVNYKAMAAVDNLQRTEFAWQHRFRRWKSVANDLLAANPDVAGVATVATAKRTPAKNARTVKGGTRSTNGGVSDDDNEETSAVATPMSGKKRGARVATGRDSPSKKAKGAKKGTAQKVKKDSKGQVGNGTSKEEDNAVVHLKVEDAGDISQDEGVDMAFA